MKARQFVWRGGAWDVPLAGHAQLVLAFLGPSCAEEAWLAELSEAFPGAVMVGCSTAGEIAGEQVHDESVVVTAVEFDHVHVAVSYASVGSNGCSQTAGAELAKGLDPQGLSHVFVLSDGLSVNGTELVDGLRSRLPEGVAVTGGLSADGQDFGKTWVLQGGEAKSGALCAVGFYGDRLRVGYGSLGGWDSFGAERRVTRSEGNVLYELDGRSALTLYKEYLGPHAESLPASGLLFPLSIRRSPEERGIVRTILSVDEAAQSLTFAGDIPNGSLARLMKANFNRLLDGAADAARATQSSLAEMKPELAILISCVGRRMVLKQRVEDELEAVREVLGPRPVMTGFYSYGELSPFCVGQSCELHNQTMTITAFAEV